MPKGKPDSFYRAAKRQGFAARSVFKLEELDRKYDLLKPGKRVLDLGAAPGSWAQYASARVGESGAVVLIDLQPVEVTLPANCRVLCGDVNALTREEIDPEGKSFDLVVSDMAPKTTGTRDRDHILSTSLASRAFEVASLVLRKNGNFLCKVFQGPETKGLLVSLGKRFELVKSQKPAASRSESREIFLMALRFRG